MITSATGGILVGYVTKYLDSVQKGFGIVIGLLITAILTSIQKGEYPKPHAIAAGALIGIAIVVHTSFPPKTKMNEENKQNLQQSGNAISEKKNK